jgi:hypothetical protein
MLHSTRTILTRTLLALASLSLAACPGRITDPSPFIGGGGEGGTTACSIASTQIESQLIRPRCATNGCHDRSSRAGSLDLQSANVAARLIGQPSTCSGRPLVDPANRSMSYFIAKVAEATPMCGARMPLGAPVFSASEIACVRTWVAALSTEIPMMDAGVDVPNPPMPDAAVDVPNPPMPDVAQPDTGVIDTGVDAPTSMPDATPDVQVVDMPTPPADTGVAMDAAASDGM